MSSLLNVKIWEDVDAVAAQPKIYKANGAFIRNPINSRANRSRRAAGPKGCAPCEREPGPRGCAPCERERWGIHSV
jgi:hypothetical protein